MKQVLMSILPIFLTIAIGRLIKMKYIQSEEFWKYAEKITYYFFFPCLLVLKISEAKLETGDLLLPVYATIMATLLVALATFVLKGILKPSDSVFTSIFQGSTRYNSYVFIAMSDALFGTKGAAITGTFIAYMIVVTNIMSVIVLNIYGNRDKKSYASLLLSLAKNPLICFSFLGIILGRLGIHFTGASHDFLSSFAHAASPISLLAVGAGLKFYLSKEQYLATFSSIALKLVALPLATIFFLKFFGVEGLYAYVALLYSCVPTAGNSYILARQMGGDSLSIASIISLSTLVAALTATIFLGTFIQV
jgi:predicted permease